jgi:hypothetical protein
MYALDTHSVNSPSWTRPTAGIAALKSVFKIRGRASHYMTEEEIKALQEAKEAAERRAAEAEARANAEKAKAEKYQSDVQKVVSELTEERKKKNEALNKAQFNNDEPDVKSLIEQALREKEEARKKAEVELAIEEFKRSKPEFQADTAGLVFEKFKQTLNKFNFSDIQTREDARARLEDVYRFANGTASQTQDSAHDGTPNIPANIGDSPDRLKKETEKALEIANMPKEKFDKLKGKYGEALASLEVV